MRSAERLPFAALGQRLFAAALLCSGLLCSSCRRPESPITLTFLDPESMWVLGDHQMISDVYLKEFTQRTGIRVIHLPNPEDNLYKLRLAEGMLRSGASSPDVFGIDTIWSGVLANYLVDLKPAFASEAASQDRDVLESYMVQGRLVAMPYHPNVQVLIYRTDLLARYGYKRPPRTWDELEKMARRIQEGERARGQKDFWGFTWAGGVASESEQVTCEGVEWQAADGGGHIIEPDGRVSINNEHVVHAWERAAHWIGWISSPTVISYTDWDATNDFWISGRAAFLLSWSDVYQIHGVGTPFRDKAGVTSVPAGEAARVATLGGYALGVSRNSAHRAEAIKLVQFLSQKQSEAMASSQPGQMGRKVEFVEVPRVMKRIYPWWIVAGASPGGGVVSRPSAVTGEKYEAVTRAYADALHSVLTGEAKAPAATAALEQKLIAIMKSEQAASGSVH